MVSDGIYAPALICSVENFNGEVLWTGGAREREGREEEREMNDGANGKWKGEGRGKGKGHWKEEVRLCWKANSSMINTFVDVLC